jgi:hypothetical protein
VPFFNAVTFVLGVYFNTITKKRAIAAAEARAKAKEEAEKGSKDE